MKTRYLVLLFTAVLFVLAYLYYVMGETQPTHQDRIRYSPAKESTPVPSRKLLIGLKEDSVKPIKNREMVNITTRDLAQIQSNECASSKDIFTENPNYIDVESDFYKNEKRMKQKTEFILNSYNYSLYRFEKSYAQKYEKMKQDVKEVRKKNWLDIEKNFSGCGKESEVGIFMLTLAERMDKPDQKKWFLEIALSIARAYLSFKTITAQIYAIGILKNLVVSKQIKGYLVHELYALGEDIDRQAFVFREFLYKGAEKDTKIFLEAHENRKINFEQRIRDIMEEVLLRS